jgi:hypothetical protein
MNDHDKKSRGDLLLLAGAGTAGYLLGKKTDGSQIINQYSLVTYPLAIDPENISGSSQIGFFPSHGIQSLIFPTDYTDSIPPATQDILFVDCLYHQFRRIMNTSPNIGYSSKIRVARHCANLISGLASRGFHLSDQAAVLHSYSPSTFMSGSGLVMNVGSIYNQPYGARRRRLDSKRVPNIIKYLTFAFNDYLNSNAYAPSLGEDSGYKVGDYVVQNADGANYVQYLYEGMKEGSILLPVIDSLHMELRNLIASRSLRRVFVNSYSQLLLVDYPAGSGEQFLFNQIFNLLQNDD